MTNEEQKEMDSLRQSNLLLRRIISDALVELHHKKNGEFASLPRLIADLKRTDKWLSDENAELKKENIRLKQQLNEAEKETQENTAGTSNSGD